jgi:hypothetical protein
MLNAGKHVVCPGCGHDFAAVPPATHTLIRELQEEVAVLRKLLGESARREGAARATLARLTN